MSLSPSSITSSADISIATSASIPAGQHTLTLRAASGSIERIATLTNVTISGNSASSFAGGGGIYNRGTLYLNFSAIINNTAPWGGGLCIYGGTVRLRGVILSGNTATSGTGPECEGSFTGLGFTTDARGVARPQNGSCDIGAVERQ